MAAKSVGLRPAKVDQKNWPLKAEIKAKSAIFTDNHLPGERPVPEGNAGSNSNIAAIDFGTTHCSLAYTTENSDLIVSLKLNEIWPRVPTAILLYKQEEEISVSRGPLGIRCRVHAFGKDAQTQYQRIRAADRSKYIYFERMKMRLQHDKVSDQSCTTTMMPSMAFWFFLSL